MVDKEHVGVVNDRDFNIEFSLIGYNRNDSYVPHRRISVSIML
jgi:hypothetical protein